MKLAYTKKELINLGWGTIGGRIEDYAAIINGKGPLLGASAAYEEITRSYYDSEYDLAGLVYRGLIVYIGWGTDAYYGIKPLN